MFERLCSEQCIKLCIFSMHIEDTVSGRRQQKSPYWLDSGNIATQSPVFFYEWCMMSLLHVTKINRKLIISERIHYSRYLGPMPTSNEAEDKAPLLSAQWGRNSASQTPLITRPGEAIASCRSSVGDKRELWSGNISKFLYLCYW